MRENIDENTPEINAENEISDISEENKSESNFSNTFQDDETADKNARYTEGQSLRFVRVRFPGNARSFPFQIGKRTFAYGQKVLAMSDRGMTVGYINSFPYELPYRKEMDPIRSINKVATDDDVKEQKSYYEKEKEAERACLKYVEKYNLDMTVTHVEFIQFGKKAVFYFNSPGRVDFRDLVKDLVGELRMRIELRQISVRDRAAALGGIGVCGLQTCCSSFLSTYGNVSIKMAKNQNLALIPSKINGICGQLKCCIKYEDMVYTEKRKRLPRENSIVVLRNGDTGKVLRLQVLNEIFEMITDQGLIRRYTKNLYDRNNSQPGPDYQFPTSFESVNNETSTLIDLPEFGEKLVEEKFLENDLSIENAQAVEEHHLETLETENQDEIELDSSDNLEDENDEEQVSSPVQQTSPNQKKPEQNQQGHSNRPHHNKQKRNRFHRRHKKGNKGPNNKGS